VFWPYQKQEVCALLADEPILKALPIVYRRFTSTQSPFVGKDAF